MWHYVAHVLFDIGKSYFPKIKLNKNKNIYELQEKIVKIKFHHEKNPPSHLHIIIWNKLIKILCHYQWGGGKAWKVKENWLGYLGFKSGLRNCPDILTGINPHHTMYIVKWAPFHLKSMECPLKPILALKISHYHNTHIKVFWIDCVYPSLSPHTTNPTVTQFLTWLKTLKWHNFQHD
jgi:hypothetical protein